MEEKSPLFTELSSEESAAVSGGEVSFDLDTYMYILGAAILFGNPGLTSEEIHFAWMSAFIFNDNSDSDFQISTNNRSSRRSTRRRRSGF